MVEPIKPPMPAEPVDPVLPPAPGGAVKPVLILPGWEQILAGLGSSREAVEARLHVLAEQFPDAEQYEHYAAEFLSELVNVSKVTNVLLDAAIKFRALIAAGHGPAGHDPVALA